MPVRIRLQRRGRKKRPFYHIVIADARAKRDGRMIEKIGSYNPLTVPATIELDRDRAFDWLMKGAQPTQTVKAILRFKGIYYRKHLMRGVAKGALTEEEAMAKYHAWIEAKEAKIQKRREQEAEKRAQFLKMIDGTAPAPKKEEAPASLGDEGAKSEEPKTLLESVEKTEIDVTSGEVLGGEAPAEAEEVKEEAKAEEAPAEAEEVKEEAKAEEAPAEAEEAKEEVKAEEAPAEAEEAKEEAKAEEAPAETEEAKEEAKAEEAPAETEEVKEEAKAEEAPAQPAAKAPKQDDLKVIEGIGPKIAELLTEKGIDTWAKLAQADPEALKTILEEAGSRFAMHNPATWPQQAQLCVEGKWEELKELQDRLDGGVDKG